MLQSLKRSCLKAEAVGRNQRMTARSASTAAVMAPPPSTWAIIRVAGVSQFVEEGRTLALATLPQAARLGKNIVQFRDVLAFKSHGGRLRQAKKGVLQDVVVEGSIEGQFQATHGPGPVPITLNKVIITAIRKASTK